MDFLRENWQTIAIVAAVLIVGYFVYMNYFCPKRAAPVQENMHGGASNDKADKQQDNEQFVMFYMPWCGACKKVMPVWNKLNIKDIAIQTVNCEEHPNVTEEHNIVSFPTFRFYPNGMADTDNYVPYDGDRTMQDFMKFLGQVKQ